MTKVWEDSKGGEQGVDRYNPAAPDFPGYLSVTLILPMAPRSISANRWFTNVYVPGSRNCISNEPTLRRVQIEGLRVTAGFPVWISAVPKQVAALLIHGVKL